MSSKILEKNLEKLQSYSFYKGTKTLFKASRSINPQFPQISKQDDVTKYNSANFNVYFYKDYPNRSGTPIKCSFKTKKLEFQRSVSPKREFVTSLMGNSFEMSPEAKNKIIYQALSAQIRKDTSPPKLVIVSSGPKGSVMNDFHKRETNPGFARNGSGGFYTR